MDALDADSPPLPRERSAPPAALNTGCILVCGVMALPLLYIGSFALLLADEHFEGPFLRSLDDSSLEILFVIYWPLICLYDAYLS